LDSFPVQLCCNVHVHPSFARVFHFNLSSSWCFSAHLQLVCSCAIVFSFSFPLQPGMKQFPDKLYVFSQMNEKL
jgi:hypothetical protein